jgi:hypothetical protein
MRFPFALALDLQLPRFRSLHGMQEAKWWIAKGSSTQSALALAKDHHCDAKRLIFISVLQAESTSDLRRPHLTFGRGTIHIVPTISITISHRAERLGLHTLDRIGSTLVDYFSNQTYCSGSLVNALYPEALLQKKARLMH